MEYRMQEHSFAVDLPFGTLQVSGDDQYGFRPYQLLVSSVAVCSGGVLRKILTKMRLAYEDIRIVTHVTRNSREADRIERIHLHFVVQARNLPEAKLERALALTRKNCSMVQSVKDSIEVTETFEITQGGTNHV